MATYTCSPWAASAPPANHCGKTVRFETKLYEIESDDDCDEEILHIPLEDSKRQGKEDVHELLPVMQMLVRTILQDKHAELNRTSCFEAVKRFASTMVEVERLQEQVRDLARTDDCKQDGQGLKEDRRRALTEKRNKAESKLLERCLQFFGKSGTPKQTTGHRDLTSSRGSTAQVKTVPSDVSGNPVSSGSESRLEMLRNRRRHLESHTQDLLKMDEEAHSTTSRSTIKTTGSNATVSSSSWYDNEDDDWKDHRHSTSKSNDGGVCRINMRLEI